MGSTSSRSSMEEIGAALASEDDVDGDIAQLLQYLIRRWTIINSFCLSIHSQYWKANWWFAAE